MSKATNAVIAALKAKFETGDIPDGPDFAQAIQLLQDAIQEHAHASGGGVGSGTGNAAQVAYPGDLKDLFFDWPLSPMLVDGGTIETGTNANSVKVGSLTAILRKTNAADGILAKVAKAAEDNIVLTNPDIIYRVVLQYNSGTPAIVLQAAEPNRTTDISIGKCIRDSAGNVHLINAGYRLSNGLAKLHRRAAQLRKLELAIGCVIEHTGTRNFTIGEGHVYGGINEFNPFEAGDFASLTDKFTLVYNDGSWQYVTDQTAIPNDKYNDYGVGLANLGNNKYGCFWIYLHPDDEHVYVLYGTDTYTLTEALLANPPSNVPGLLADFGVMLGCIVVKEGAALFASIQMVTDVVFAGVEAADHGGLAGLSDDDHPQYLLANGARGLTADWNIGNGRAILADKVRARDGDGLSLQDDGGNGPFIADGGSVVNTAQPAFSAHLTAGEYNVTGDGTVWHSYDGASNWTEIVDQGNNFNGDGTFTAPVDGVYLVMIGVYIGGMTAANEAFKCNVVTSNRTAFAYQANADSLRDASALVVSVSQLMWMDANDTMYVTVEVTGGTKIVYISTQFYLGATLMC